MIVEIGSKEEVLGGRMYLSVEEIPGKEDTSVLAVCFVDGPHIVNVEYKTEDKWQKKKAYDYAEGVIHQMGMSLMNIMLYGSSSHTMHLRAHCNTPVSNKKHYLIDDLDKDHTY